MENLIESGFCAKNVTRLAALLDADLLRICRDSHDSKISCLPALFEGFCEDDFAGAPAKASEQDDIDKERGVTPVKV